MEYTIKLECPPVLETKICSPQQVPLEYVQQIFEDRFEERIYSINMNCKKDVLSHKLISVGTSTSAMCDVAKIARSAILSGATSVILLHNHPSGDPTPSQSDFAITNKTKEALNLFNINLDDHIIYGYDELYSMRENTQEEFN